MYKPVPLIVLLLACVMSVPAATIPALTNSSGNTASIRSGPAVIVDSGLTVSGAGDISGARVYIDPYRSGDTLSFAGGSLPSGTSGSFDTGTGVLTFSGTASPTQWQALLRTVTFRTTSLSGTQREINFSLGESVSYSGNGHYYEWVDSAHVTWTAARDAAAAKSLYGMQGYLVTVTSSGENGFIGAKLNGQGWMGASDAAEELTWRWVTGPEGLEDGGAGRHFFTQTSSYPSSGGGSAVGGCYSNWAQYEPNNWGYDEDHAHFLDGGQWNDYRYDNSSIVGYVVEYGGMPGDPVLHISDKKTVDVTLYMNIQASAGPGGTISPSGAVGVTYGASQGFSISASTGNHIADVQVDGESVGAVASYSFASVTADHAIAAGFEVNTYTLTYAAGANGSISGATPQTVAYGGSGTAVTAVPAEHYRFMSWSDGSTANPRTDAGVTASLSVTASFALCVHTISFQTDRTKGARLVGVTLQAVEYGGSCSAVSAIAPAGYHFVNWTGSGGFPGSEANPLTLSPVRSDSVIVAHFAANGPPLVRITAPEPGAAVNGVVRIEAEVESDRGVRDLAFFIDGVPLAAGDKGRSQAQPAPAIDLGGLRFDVGGGLALGLDDTGTLLLLDHERRWRRLAGAEAGISGLAPGEPGRLFVRRRPAGGLPRWFSVDTRSGRCDPLPAYFSGPRQGTAQWRATPMALAFADVDGAFAIASGSFPFVDATDREGCSYSWNLPLSAVDRAVSSGGRLAIAGTASGSESLCLIDRHSGMLQVSESGRGGLGEWAFLEDGSLLVAVRPGSPARGGWGILWRTERGWIQEEMAPTGHDWIGLAALPGSAGDDLNERPETSHDMAETRGINWDTRPLAPGLHSVRALAVDLDGQEGSDEIEVWVQNLVLDLSVIRYGEDLWIIRHDYAEIVITVRNPGAAPVARCILERSVGGDWSTVAEIAADSMDAGVYRHRDAELERGRQYVYRVRALDHAGAVLAVSPAVTI